MRTTLLACLVLASVACRSGAQADAESDAQSEDANEASGAETGFPIPDDCSSAMPCEAGYCVAAWDPDADPARGPAQCVPECVESLDLAKFCIDDASCCEGLECSLDGLCEPPFESSTDTDASTDTGSDTGSDGGTDGGSDTGSSTDTSTDSGTDTTTG